MTLDATKIVALLNQLIEEAVEDGGDAGGAYNQNQIGLAKAIENILNYLELSDYEVTKTNDYHSWSRIKIGERKEDAETN